MEPLDGNAIAGDLLDVFGAEMTTAVGTCAGCRGSGRLAQLEVYLAAPGVVARCRHCSSVMIVLVTVRGTTCVDLMGMSALSRPA